MPIPPATFFRALFGSFFIENLWNWVLLQAVVMGYALISTLGWQALSWLVLLQLGIVVAVFCTMAAMLLVLHYLVPRGQGKIRIAVVFILGLLLVLMEVYHGQVTMEIQALAFWLRPEFVSILFALLLAVVWGPLASSVGKLYIATFYIRQSGSGSSVYGRGIPLLVPWGVGGGSSLTLMGKAFTLPGTRALVRLFARRRSITGALFAKSLFSQSRNWIFWARLAAIPIVIALFPLLRTAIAHYGFSDTVLVAGYAAGVAILHIIETAPNAISGEANLLTLYLTAPFELSHILRARLTLFLMPVLIEGVVVGLFLSWRLGLTLSQVGFAVVAIVFMVSASVVLLVFGSAWDEDLNLAVEGLEQTLMQEEMPISPRRMWLFNASIVLFALMVLLLWKVPAGLALGGLVVVDVVIVGGMWRFGKGCLRRLLRGTM